MAYKVTLIHPYYHTQIKKTIYATKHLYDRYANKIINRWVKRGNVYVYELVNDKWIEKQKFCYNGGWYLYKHWEGK